MSVALVRCGGCGIDFIGGTGTGIPSIVGAFGLPVTFATHAALAGYGESVPLALSH